MKKIIYLFFTTCLLALVLISCHKDEYRGESLSLNTSVEITNFSVANIVGAIGDTGINLNFSFGYNYTNVSPVITIPNGATVSPASGVAVDLTTSKTYRVVNGNLYKDYIVSATEDSAIISFVIAGVTATVNEKTRTITASLPAGTDIASLAPTITLVSGATISPASGTVQDFTNAVTYTVKKDTATVNYKVVVSSPDQIAFLGTAATAGAITNADESAAWAWLSSFNPKATYISFDDIQAGKVELNQYAVIWWHEDASQSLPTVSSNATILKALQNYYAGGGSFLLTSYAGLYVESLGIVPAGMGPNNAFGDVTPWLETSSNWGISYKGYESHPAFSGLATAPDKSYATAYLLSSGTYRLNHVAQWHIGTDWGEFSSPSVWRTKTGGLDLGSSEGDENHTSSVTMAAFPRTAGHGATIVIVAGAYDWYSEANPANPLDQPANTYLSNMHTLTGNVLGYLSK